MDNCIGGAHFYWDAFIEQIFKTKENRFSVRMLLMFQKVAIPDENDLKRIRKGMLSWVIGLCCFNVDGIDRKVLMGIKWTDVPKV
jgi:hypothetical protein